MLLLLIPVIVLAIGIVVGCIRGWDGVFEVLLTTGGAVVLFIVLIVFGASRIESTSFIREVEAVRQTIAVARENNWSGYERAALQTKVVEINAEIASMQYQASTPWLNWFFNPQILDIKPVE
jgi:hypothetical protein